MVRSQALLGASVLGLGAFLAIGSRSISSEAGYGGVGPNFLPLVTGLSLVLCGLGLMWEATRGGYQNLDEPSGAQHGDWIGFAWVSAGILANALLIERIGFIFACALCFLLAVRGLRLSKGEGLGSVRSWFTDAITGMAIAAPVYWMFTKALGVSLPGVTGTGWL